MRLDDIGIKGMCTGLLILGSTLWPIRSLAQFVIPIPGSVDRPSTELWSDTVLCAFINLFPLGTMYPDGHNRPDTIDFSKGATVALQEVLRNTKQTDPSGPAKLLKVNAIQFTQYSGFAHCGLNIEVLERREGQHFRSFEYGTAVSVPFRGTDLSEYGTGILSALQEAMDSYDLALSNGTTTSVLLADAALRIPPEIGLDLAPVLGAPSFRRGLYKTFMDMRADRPDSTLAPEMHPTARSTGEDQVVRLKKIDTSISESIWGFSNGWNVYKRVGKDFVRLDRRSGRFLADLSTKPTYNAGEIAAAAAGGLLLGLIGGLIVVPFIDHTAETVPVLLDMRTGEFVARPADPSDNYTMHIFQYSRFAETDDAVIVSWDPDHAVRLTRRQWVALTPAPQERPLEVRIRSEHGEGTSVLIDTRSERTQVYAITKKRTRGLNVDQLNIHMASPAIDALDRKDQRH